MDQTKTGAPIDLETVRGHVTDFVSMTGEARALSEKCRDYIDGKQLTEDMIRSLKRRKQAPIVNNRIKTKYQGLLGLTVIRKSDPKAYPRTQKDSGAAEAATDGLRYVADDTHFESVKMAVAGNLFGEGYGGCYIPVEQTQKGIEIRIEEIAWDRIYFDPNSRKPDFSDARYKGFLTWMDEDDLLDQFPEADPDQLCQDLTDDETFSDKLQWWSKNGKKRRFMVATEAYKLHGTWYICIFTGGAYLLDPIPSPYADEFGNPVCPIELVSCYIDRENNRYSEISTFLDLQDEVNHRRSKALFLNSQRQTFGNKGAVPDIKKAKTELSKADGHLEVNRGEFGKDFGLLPTGDMAMAQFQLLQEAKAEIDAQSYNAQLAGQRQKGDISGIAIQRLQQSGLNELNSLFQALTDWELRVYKQIWYRIKQFWTEEKWVRVTDDQKNLRFVGFNTPMTLKSYLEETMADESLPYPMRLGASAKLTELEKTNPQALEQVIQVKNQPSELDVDIILDQSFDTINVQAEQLDAILKFGAAQAIDIIDLLDISNVTGKDDMIERIQNRRKEAAEAQQSDPKLALLGAQAAKTMAEAKTEEQKAAQAGIETQLIQQGPIPFKGTVSV